MKLSHGLFFAFIATPITGWVLFWMHSANPPKWGTVKYFLSEQACTEHGESFRKGRKDWNYICIETEVKGD